MDIIKAALKRLPMVVALYLRRPGNAGRPYVMPKRKVHSQKARSARQVKADTSDIGHEAGLDADHKEWR